MARYGLIFVAAQVLFVGYMRSAERVTLTSELIASYAEQARTHNVGLRAMASRVQAGGFAIDAVRVWEDPMAKFGGGAATARGPKLGEEGNLLYGIEQKLPLFGKARAAQEVATRSLDLDRANAEYAFVSLRREIAQTMLRAALAEATVQLGLQDVAQLEVWVSNAEKRYAAGTGSQIEILRLQNESAKRGQDLKTREAEREHENFTLNRLRNLPLEAPVPRFDLPALAEAIPYSEALSELALRHEPRLNRMNQEARMAEARVEYIRRQRLPDFTIGVEGRQYSGDAGLRQGMLTLGLNLPWFNRRGYRSDLHREQATAEAARFEVADYELAVRQEVHLLTVRMDAARREALTYANEILPRSEQALQVASVGWINNRGMFTDLMEARRMLLEARLMQARAIAEQYQMMSELLLCCGLEDLESLQNLRPKLPASPSKSN